MAFPSKSSLSWLFLESSASPGPSARAPPRPHRIFSFILALCLFQLKLWIDEKMLTAQDVSYDEARNLHTKWQKHQAFMAELAANKDWLDKVDKEEAGGSL